MVYARLVYQYLDEFIKAMQKLFLLAIILLFTTCIDAQQKCELKMEQSPTIKGLKLGMSPQDATTLLGMKVKAKLEGQYSFFKNYIKKKAKGKLVGIRAMYLRFYNGKLYQIEVFYEKDFRWQTLETFIDDYSNTNNFQRGFWQTEYGYSKATCNGFSLDADYILNPHIQITKDATAKIVEEELAKETKLFDE